MSYNRTKLFFIALLSGTVTSCQFEPISQPRRFFYGQPTDRSSALYECPRINGFLSLSNSEYYKLPQRFSGGGSYDYPNGGESVGPVTKDCSDSENSCMEVDEPLPGLEGVIMAPKVITKTGRYLYKGHTAYVERYLGRDLSNQNPFLGKQAIVRVPIGSEVEDRNIILLIQDQIGVIAIDGIRMETVSHTDGTRARILDIGQCTFVEGKALFAGTRVQLAVGK
jgi:hypothetical protein